MLCQFFRVSYSLGERKVSGLPQVLTQIVLIARRAGLVFAIGLVVMALGAIDDYHKRVPIELVNV
jgi:hypothetical protein